MGTIIKTSSARRDSLRTSLAVPSLTALALANEAASDIKITRIVHCRIPARRSKLAGKNSRGDVHGDSSGDNLIRLTNTGEQGFDHGRLQRKQAESLIGKNPFDFVDQKAKRVSEPFGTDTMSLRDLAGKILGKSVHAMLGGNGTSNVPVYDGSIYFADLLPDYASKWKDRFHQEIDMGLEAGHTAFKVKVGRGA